jgi:hypothetical protein
MRKARGIISPWPLLLRRTGAAHFPREWYSLISGVGEATHQYHEPQLVAANTSVDLPAPFGRKDEPTDLKPVIPIAVRYLCLERCSKAIQTMTQDRQPARGNTPPGELDF